MTKLGKNQLCLLATMASPFSLLIVGDKLSATLVSKGLLEPRHHSGKGGFLGITPRGLYALGDAMTRGDIEQFFDPKFQRDRARIYISGQASPGESRASSRDDRQSRIGDA